MYEKTFHVVMLPGGVMSSSLAIATDAAHLLTDLISFVISLFAIFIGSRAPTKRMSFGYYRAGTYMYLDHRTLHRTRTTSYVRVSVFTSTCM